MAGSTLTIPVCDYDLAATLQSGQSFVWVQSGQDWEGVVASRWVRLRQLDNSIVASTAEPVSDWEWLLNYLQATVDLGPILASFPDDEPMRRSVGACRGLRLLRQDPWECLASFILSSTKRIVQIQQVVTELRTSLGPRLAAANSQGHDYGFPSPQAVVAAGESQLRACKMGFRAPNLLATARRLVEGELDLASLQHRTLDEARQELIRCPGVGPKIADCVLLFGFGFLKAFPVDVWVMKAMRQLYFPKRRPSPERLRRFIASYFGDHAGYAQQYLFHYMRVAARTPALPNPLQLT